MNKNNLNLEKDCIYNNCNNNTFNNSSNTEINLELSTNQNQNEVILKDIVENFLQKKISKENEHKYQIKQNKKNILEKFYSMTNIDYINQQNKNKLQEAEFNFNNQNNNNSKNNNDANQVDDYDEIREKYKIERNKKKSSIFKSEDLHISNTNIVHINNKNEDYSPINPNVVDIENKNNIFIIQKKLFGDNDNNNDGDVEKIEDIDEIELDFSEINNNKYEESQILSSNNKNNNEDEKNVEKKRNDNNNIITNIDINNNNNYFSNDILVEKKEIDLCFTSNNKINFKKVNGINKIKQRSKNYSVQLVSSLGFVINNLAKRNNGNNNYPFINHNDNNLNLIQNGENSKLMNQMTTNDFRNNKLKKNNTDYTDINGNLIHRDYEDNDNSNNTIVPGNQNNCTNNNYNGKYSNYDNKLINGSNDYQSINKIKNNYLIKNKYLQKNKTSNKKNNSFQNNVAYIDYKNISGRVNNNNNNQINHNKNNIIEKNLIKPKNFKLKKKNNSFVLNRDINKINNNVASKSIYQNLNSNNNKIIFCNDNYNSNTQKNLLNYNNEINNGKNQDNKVIPIISKMPISLKVKKNLLIKNGLKNSTKNTKRKIGNKIAVLNSLLNNNLILFQKPSHQQEAIEKLKSRQNNGVYFIYADKVNEGYSFKGIYKRGTSEINHICNKIYGIPNSPLILLYEKFYILVENEDKTFEFKKLSDINVFSFVKSILLIKNK